MLADASDFTVSVETFSNEEKKTIENRRTEREETITRTTKTTNHWSSGKKVLVIGAGSSTKLESTSQIIKGIFRVFRYLF